MRNLHARMLVSLLSVTLLLHAKPAASQTIDESFRADIEKLLEATGAARMGSQVASLVFGQVVATLKKSQPQVPDRAIALMQQVIDAEFAKAFTGPEGLTRELVAIYAKHYTHDEVRGLLAFYETPLGKKTIEVMPVVFQEGAAAGQHWAEREMPRIAAALQARLRSEGLIK